jgi:NAD(P)-dependent dehydrogenase (short-subunit alcohol dehydrogenase family)
MVQQVVLITGALTGIGRATAVAFAGKGANVVVSGRHDDTGKDLVTELRALAPRQSSFGPTFRRKTTSATSSTRQCRDSAVWTLP